MPLNDCMLLLKPNVRKEALMELVARVGKHVFFKDTRGQLMQMTMMATPNINKELHYLNKEDRLLRWLLVKHRDIKYGMEFLTEEDGKTELSSLSGSSINDEWDKEDDSDEDRDIYDAEQEQKKSLDG
ncbi:hypothetical protein EZV62_007740 [Acer yangbiense]|uniref:Uncharacterized protein n=1 Tax=Acer yangbiense TaxID=1000413 RepID=A0A5C7IB54_9ROSI|nr:hypothetical protein EZV62_007740 [Acer yangbiense]